VYKNQLEHDPLDIHRAREIASSHEDIPVGILYQNPDVPCYEDIRLTKELRTPERTRAGLNSELDKYTVWPRDAAEKAA
jgi:2-oxoglutarate ferredoxin oxidoreductase subunit beta